VIDLTKTEQTLSDWNLQDWTMIDSQKTGRLKMQEWNLRHDMARMENAGLEWYGKPLVFKLTKLLENVSAK